MRRAFYRWAIAITVAIAACAFAIPLNAQLKTQVTSLTSAQLITPEELVTALKAAKGEKPLILNVGPRLLFAQAHIPGAEFIGPGSDPEALQALRTRVKSLPRNKFIVLYCGCCPWNHCPNVLPAYRALAEMGFTKAKVLYITDNLGADWVYKGYPTTKGE